VSTWAITAILFVCVFGGGLLGLLLRSVLPEHHLDDRSKDVVRLGMGLLATIAALVLGLLVASAKSSYDEQKGELDQMSTNVILIDIALAKYGDGARETRKTLRDAVALAIARIWPEDTTQHARVNPETTADARFFYGKIQDLAPTNDRQRELRSLALQLAVDLGRARWLLVAQEESGAIPLPFLVVLIFWLAALFASFGLFAPPNATVITTLLLCAVSVSGAVFLILELAQPFAGLIKISNGPLRDALAHLGQ
jgi:hypothetical protein